MVYGGYFSFFVDFTRNFVIMFDGVVIVALSVLSIELVLFHVLQRCCYMRPSARIGVNMSPSFTAISI